MTAWETAKELVAKETEIRAEAKVLGQPRILQTHERRAMMKAVEALYGVISDAEAPSADYLSQKSEETETNEPVASPLDEVISRKESTTHLRVTRTKCKRMPASTEDYRRVIVLRQTLGCAWQPGTGQNLGCMDWWLLISQSLSIISW